MGVQRAMDLALREARRTDQRVLTVGPLVHNPQALDMLARCGVVVRAPEDRLDAPDTTIVVRAHGIPPDERRRLVETGARLVDATCPKVARAQAAVRTHAREGREVVIVGDPAHAEVVGLLGFAEGRGRVVETVDEARSHPFVERLCVVAQTTLQKSLFRAIAEVLCTRTKDCAVIDTICDATELRQEEMRRLARAVDLVVVVGGRDSANTAQLADIARRQGVPAFHVERADDLDGEAFLGVGIVAVMAGASTPQEVLEEVLCRLRSFGGELEEEAGRP